MLDPEDCSLVCPVAWRRIKNQYLEPTYTSIKSFLSKKVLIICTETTVQGKFLDVVMR